MSNKYFTGRKGGYVYCDICGQACYIFETKRLSSETGRGGLIVCSNDRDKVDPGLVAYIIPPEKRVLFARPNNTYLTNAEEPYNIENNPPW